MTGVHLMIVVFISAISISFQETTSPIALVSNEFDSIGYNYLQSFEFTNTSNSNWNVTCEAKKTSTGEVILLPYLKKYAQGLLTNYNNIAIDQFQLEITTRKNGSFTDGVGTAVYIVDRLSINVRCGNAKDDNQTFGVYRTVSEGLVVRVQGNKDKASTFLFPAVNSNYPFLSTTNNQLGNGCSLSGLGYIGESTMILRFKDDLITVVLTGKDSGGQLKTATCVDGISDNGKLKSLLLSGKATVVVVAATANPQSLAPTVTRVALFKLTDQTTTTTSTTTSTTSTQPVTTMSLLSMSTNVQMHSSTVGGSQTVVPSSKQSTTTYEKSSWDSVIVAIQKHGSVVANPKTAYQSLIPVPTTPESSSPKWILIDQVSKCRDLSPTIFAPGNFGKPTEVKVAFTIYRLVEFDTIKETLRVFGTLLTSWTTGTCPVLATEPPMPPNHLERLFAATPGDTWLPPYIFTTSPGDIFMTSSKNYDTDLTGLISKSVDGKYKLFDFYLSRHGLFDTMCELDLAVFPFDSQKCLFTFSLQRPNVFVNFKMPIILCPEMKSTEWRFINCSSNRRIEQLGGSPAVAMTFEVELKRKATYYLINVLLPNMLLTLLELSCWLIPVSKAPRSLFSITIVLALIVNAATVLNVVPKTSQRILFIDYFLQMAIFGIATTGYHVIAFSIVKMVRANKKSRGRFDAVAFIVAFGVFGAISGLFFSKAKF